MQREVTRFFVNPCAPLNSLRGFVHCFRLIDPQFYPTLLRANLQCHSDRLPASGGSPASRHCHSERAQQVGHCPFERAQRVGHCHSERSQRVGHCHSERALASRRMINPLRPQISTDAGVEKSRRALMPDLV